MRDFGIVLAAGRFDVTTEQAQAAWTYFRTLPDVALIVGTEYGSGNFDLAFVADGWEHYRAPGEVVVAWRTDVFEPAWKGAGHSDRIGTEFWRGGNDQAQTPLTSMPLRHVATRAVLMVRGAHLPAHVQAGDEFRKTTPRVIEQGKAWVSSLAVMGRRARRFAKRRPDAAEIDIADFNVDLLNRHWRFVVRVALGLRCVWPLPDGGDLGARLVTWAFQRGLRIRSTELLPKQRGYDHLPIYITGRIKRGTS